MGKKRNKVEIFKLEDRVLFEAGAVVQAAEAAAADQANNDAAGDGSAAAEMQSDNNQTASNELTPDNLAEMPVPPEMSGSDNADDTADADAADFAAADPESETVAFTDAPIAVSETSERILVVLNSSVADADSIVNDLGDNVEVLRLEAGTDALDTINDYLDEHADTKYSAIHLVSHGSEGYITLNGEKIDSTTINPADWKAIGEHLTDDADILVYGCDTAKSEEGKALVQTIANLTGADVAASIDSTGATGDWDLEYRSGLIEAATIAPQSYQYSLEATTITVTTLDDVVDAEDGVTSLREAITEANTNGGEYTISFDQNLAKVDTNGDGTADVYQINLTSTLSISTSGLNLTIDGMIGTDRVILDGGDKYDGTTVTTHSGVQIFTVAADTTLNLSNTTLQNGYVDGNGGAISNAGTLNLSGVTLTGNTATGNGGAISNSGTLNLSEATFTGNTATVNGGAISNSGTLLVNRSYFDGNSDAGTNGSSAVYADGGTVTVMNSTIANHSTGALGLNGATGLVLNSTFYGNTGADLTTNGATDTLAVVNSITTSSATAVDGSTISIFNSIYVSASTSTGVTYTDSTQLSSAADIFGSNTLTDGIILPVHDAAIGTLKTLSINADGNLVYDTTVVQADTALTADQLALLETDQNGNGRGTKTLGAVSVAETASLTVTTQDDVVNAYDGVITLREAITYAKNLPAGLTTELNGTAYYKITFADGISKVELTKAMSSVYAFTISSGNNIWIDGGSDVTLDLSASNETQEINRIFKIGGGNLYLSNIAIWGTGSDANGDVYLTDSTRRSYTTAAAVKGGGQLVHITSGSLIADGVTFSRANGTYSGHDGGAIWGMGGKITISNSTFSDNYGTSATLIGLHATKPQVVLNNVTITGNNTGAELFRMQNSTADNQFNNITINNAKITQILWSGYGGKFTVNNLVMTNSEASDILFQLAYNTGSVTINDVTLTNNKLANNVFHSASTAGNHTTLSNMTVYNNNFTAEKSVLAFGGGNDAQLVNVFNNTIAGNTGKVIGSFSYSAGSGKLNLLNNIFMDSNGTSSVSITKGTATGVYGNVYADGATVNAGVTLNGLKLPVASTDLGEHNTLSTAAKVFGTEDLSTVWDGKTLAISADGAAADSGVLVGKIGSTFYVMQDGKWYAAATQAYYADFTPDAATGYGLGGTATVYTTAQNTVADGENQVPADRLYSLNNSGSEMIQVGAYALQVVSTKETLPVIVVPGLTLSTTYGEAVANPALSETQKEVTVKIGDENVTLYLDITWSVADGIALDGTQNAGTYNNVFSIDTITVYDALGTDVTAQYKISPFVTSSFEVAKKAITVSANRAAKNYGVAEDPALNYRVYGLVGSDTLSGELARVAGEEVGTYEIQIGTLGADNTNYEITFNSANFTIRPEGTVAPVITLDSSYTYKGNNVYGQAIDLVDDKIAHTIQVDGADVTLYLDVEWKAADGIATDGTQNAGTVENGLSVVYVTAYADDGNGGYTDVSDQYDFSYDGILADLVVKKATVTVSGITAESKEYNGLTDVVLNYDGVTFNGLVNGDNLTVTATGAFADANADTGKTVNLSGLTLGGEAAANYELAAEGQQTTASADITAKTITVKADDIVIKEGETAPALTYTVEEGGLVGDDKLTGALEREAGTGVGIYQINQGTLGVADTNYLIEFTPGIFKIAPANPQIFITVDAYAATNTYGEALSLTETGKEVKIMVEGEEKTFYLDIVWKTDGTVAEDGTQNAGTYEDVITIHSVTVFEKDGENYVDVTDLCMLTLPAEAADLVIGKASLTVTADAKSITAGDAEPELTYTVDGLKNGDVFTGTLVRAEGTAAGVYAITLADGYTITNGADDKSANYDFTFAGADLSIKEAASLTVTTLEDVVDAYDNLTSLREAIAYANKTEGAQTITFDSTVFTDTTTEYVIDLATTLLVTDAVTISNTTGTKIVLNGGNTVTVDPTTKKATFGEDGIRIMEIAADSATTIDGLIFRNGYEYGDLRTFSGSTQKYGGGGAIFTVSALTVRNSSFEYNNYKSDQDTSLAITLGGGAIFAYNTELTIEDSSFVGNAMNIQSAWAYSGGSAICALSTDLTISGSSFLDHVSGAGKQSGKFAVVYARNAKGLAITDSTFSGNAMPGVAISGGSGTMTVSGSTFDSNTYGLGGCALTADTNAALTIDDCTFSNNVSDNVWGAVLKLGAGSYTVRNCTFTDNINSGASTNVGGGAIYLSTNQKGSLTVTDCEFTGNQVTKEAPIGGGAIYANYNGTDGGTINITDSTFTNNSSGSQGGAIYASTTTGTVTISGNTFTENTATGNGGAIYLSNTSGTNVLANNTFTDNSAVAGGAVYVVSGETSITGSTFKGNSAVGDGGALHTAADTTISNSIFGSTTEGEGNSGAHGMTIYQAGGAMVITNSSIVGSTSTTQWADIGAIHANGTSLALYGVQITDNKANGSFSNNNGGGVVVKSGTLTVDSYIDPTTSAETKTTIARNLAGTNGGGIYFAANTSGTIKNAVFDSNTGAIQGGGAIYGATGTTISIENTLFNSNSASGWGSSNGGAINFAGTSLIIKNSLFSGNSATHSWNDGQAPDSGGGAIYVSAGTVDVINSTFYNNLGRVGNGFQVTGGTVNLVNSTMYSTGTTSSVEITGGTFNAINSIVSGTVNGTLNNINSVVGADAADIFTSTTLTADNTLEIKADSAAAYAGALVGQLDGAYYYMDNGKWFALDGTEKAAFALDADTGYGLGDTATIYTTAQNTDAEGNAVSRLDGANVGVFTAGAYALSAETPSLTVNTDQDILNPFDGQISLREALQYAANDAAAVKGGAASIFTSGFDATAKTYTINFADTVTKITVGSTLNVATDAFKTYSLIINGAIASGKVILDGGNTVTFNADGSYASHSGTGVQIMNLHGGNKVTLNDLILQNGLAGSFAGGVHADSGTLNVNNSIFRYNVSSGYYNGGAALVNGSGTTNITGSLFEQNVGTGVYTQGGAFYTRGTAYISDSTFVRNWNNGLGGAIFSNGGYVHLLNSTIADNRANSGGAILLRTSSAYLINSTITGNTTVSTNNGAIGYSDGSVSDTIIVLNSIVAGNSSNDIANGNANTKISLINSVYGSVQVPADFANLTVTGGQKYDSSTQTLSDIFETVADGRAVATVQTVNGVDHEVFALSRDGLAAQSGTLVARTTTNSGLHGTRTQYYYLDMANDNWICATDSTVVVPFVLANTDGSYGLQTGVQEHIAKFDTATNAAFKTYHVFEDAQNVDENGDRVDRLYALKLQEKPQEIFQIGAYAFNFLPKQPIALTVDGYSATNTYGDALVLTETKKEITVTVDGVEKTYYLDLVWKTNGTVAEDGTQVVGTYEDVISIDSVAVFEKDGENYVDVTDDFELTLPADSDLVIGKAALTVTADAKSITAGGAEPELTYTVDGLKNGDVFTGTLVRAEGTAAGVYAITLADGYTITNGTDDKSANYDFTFVGADLSIKEAASLTVTTLDDVVNDTDGVISFREAFAAANNKTASLAVNGVYTITFSQSLTANYDADGDTVMDSYRVALSDEYGTTLSSASITLVIDGSIGTNRVTIAGPETYQLMNFTYGTITLQDMIITGGNDISTSGGAVKANSNGGVTIRNVLFTGNKAGNGGAAIYVGQGTLNIYDSEFTGNSAPNGGVFYQGSGTLNVYNSVFTGNTGSAASVYRSHGGSTATFVNSVFYGNNSGPAFELAGANNTVTLIDCIVADNGDAADSQIKVAKDSAVMNLINTVVLKGTDNTGAAIQITAGKANLYYSVTDADYSATANFSVTGGINNATFADTLEVVDGLPRVIATSAAGKNGVLVGKDSTGAFYVFGKNATGDAANWISLADSTVTAAFNVDAAGYGLGEGATVYMDNDMKAVMVETLKAKAELTFFAGTYRSPETITLVVNDATDTANTSLLTTTLREALAFCTTVGTKYNIVFANGVNNEVNLFEKGDVTIYMSSGKGYSLSGQVNVTIDGSGDGKDTDADGTNNKVILDGRKSSTIAVTSDKDRYRIIHAGNSSLTLKNMTMQYGYMKSGKIGGGAVYTDGGSLTLNNMYFTGNQTWSAVWNFTPGGAIFAKNSTVLIVDSIFTANGTTGSGGSGGGAIHHTGGTLTIQNSKFLNNTSIRAWGDAGSASIGGGAISMMNLSSFSISGSLFEGNTVAEAGGETGGGAIVVYGCATGTISDSVFTANKVNSGGGNGVGGGGAIHFNCSGTFTITGTKFQNNESATVTDNQDKFRGGGAIAINRGSVVVEDSSFIGNKATNSENLGTAPAGGAITVGQNGSLSVTDTLFSENTTTASGGAIAARGSVTVRNSVFTDNAADLGGGGAIYFRTGDAVCSIYSSTFYGNSAVRGGAIEYSTIMWGGAKMNLHHVTLAANTATSYGGAIAFRATAGYAYSLNIYNSLILGNTSGAEGSKVCDDLSLPVAKGALNGTIAESVIGTISEKTATFSIAASTTQIASGSTDYGLIFNGKASADYTVRFNKNYGNGVVELYLPARDILQIATTANPETDQLGNTRTPGANGKYLVGAMDKLFEVPSLVVNTTEDVVDEFDGLISLREAIAYQKADPTLGNTITFSDQIDWSTTDKTITLDGTDAEGNYLGQLSLTTEVTIDGSLMFGTVAQGIITIKVPVTYAESLADNTKTVSAFRVFNITKNATLNNMILKGGKVDYGGVIYTSAYLTMDSVMVSEGAATNRGGGIYSAGSGMYAQKVTIYNNADLSRTSGPSKNGYEQGGGGLAIAKNGALNVLVNSTITGNTSDNKHANGGGSAILAYMGRLMLVSCTVTGNTDTASGMSAIKQTNTGGREIFLLDSIVAGNNSTYDIDLSRSSGTVRIANSIYGKTNGSTKTWFYESKQFTDGTKVFGTTPELLTDENGLVYIRPTAEAAGNGGREYKAITLYSRDWHAYLTFGYFDEDDYFCSYNGERIAYSGWMDSTDMSFRAFYTTADGENFTMLNRSGSVTFADETATPQFCLHPGTQYAFADLRANIQKSLCWITRDGFEVVDPSLGGVGNLLDTNYTKVSTMMKVDGQPATQAYLDQFTNAATYLRGGEPRKAVIGAALPQAEVKTGTVNTDLDVVDVYDGLISLREATGDYTADGDTITFADALTEVKLDSGITISKNLTFSDDNMKISGAALTIADAVSLTISTGSTFEITEGIINNGTLANNGTLTIPSLTGTGTLANNGTLSVAGAVAQAVVTNNGAAEIGGNLETTGAVTNGTGAELTVTGTFTAASLDNSGTVTANSAYSVAGTTDNKSGATLKAEGAFNAGTVNNAGNIDANSDFVVTTLVNTAGQVNLAGTTITVTDLAASTLGNVTYDGATAQQVITGTYAALILSGAGTKTASGNITASSVKNESETEVTGDLAVSGTVESTKALTIGGNYSATSTTNSSDLKVSGDFSGGTVNNTGSMTLSGATNTADAGSTLGDVTYNGAGDQAIIAGDYGDLTISSTGKATATGDIIAHGNITTSSETEVMGDVFAYGDLESTGDLTVGGDAIALQNMTLSGDTDVTGNLRVHYGDLESTGDLTVGGYVETLYGDVSLSGDTDVTGNLTAAGTLDNDAALTVGGNLTAATTDNSATLDVNGNFAGGTVNNTGSMSLAGATNFGTGTLGDVTYDGTDQQVIAGTYDDLVISSSGTATANGDITATTTTNSATLDVNGNFAGGAVTNTGAMTLSGASNTANAGSTLGDVTYDGAAQQVIAGTYGDLTINSTGKATATGDISAATVDNNANTEVTGSLTTTGDLASTAALTVGGSVESANITTTGEMEVANNLTASGTVDSDTALTVGGNFSAATTDNSSDLTVTGNYTAGTTTTFGTLDVNGNFAGGAVNNSGSMTLSGASNTANAGSTLGDVTYDGTADQEVIAGTYEDLVISTTGNATATASDAVTAATTTVNTGATLDAAGDLNAGALTNSGNISVARAFATTSTDLGAVEYDGTAAQNVVEGTYSDLSLTGGDKSLAGAVTVTDSLTADANIDTAGQDLTISGDVAGSGTISTTTDSGTVTYDGAADQNVLAGAYNNLALANGTKTLNSTASTTVNDTFTANSTTIQSDTADVLASLTVKDAGDDSTPSSAIAGTTFNGIALNNTGSADGYLYVNADTNNADDATTGVYLVGNVFVTANGIIYGDTLGEVYITVTNGNGDVISEGTADDLGWTWAVGNDAIENATTGTAYELVSKAGYKFRFHGDVDVVIGKRAITVKADDLEIDTGDDPVFTYTYVGELVGSDAFTGELASEGDGSQPGDFAITQGTLSLGDNYELTFIGGTLTVEGGGQDAHQFPNYNNPGNFAGVYDAPVHSTTHSYDHHESVPTLEHQNDRSIGFLFSVSNKQLGDATGAFGDSAPRGANVDIHAHTLSDLLKSYDKSEQIIASPANEIQDAQDDMKDLHDFSNNPFGILPDDEDLHTRAYDESIDFTVIGEDNLSTAKAEQFKDEFDAALEEILSLA